MGNAFSPIIASGSNSVSLHYERNDQVLSKGLLLLDLGAEYQYYSADISRTFPISGKFTAEERYYYCLLYTSRWTMHACPKRWIPSKS